MNSWWELEVTSIGERVEEWFFDEEPGFSVPSLYEGRVAIYNGTCGGEPRKVHIVINNCVSWTLDKVEHEEE